MLIERSLRVRGDRSVDVEIVAATTTEGLSPASDLDPVLLIHGGAAPASRYRWLAAHLASRGAVVVSPRFLFDLAFFADADADDALAAVRDLSRDRDDELSGVVADARATIVGHSLGAVVASAVFERDTSIDTAVLMSGYPDPASTPTRTDGRVVAIHGEQDGLVDEADVAAGVRAFRAQAIGVAVAGLTHYQLTDDPTESELAREGTTGDQIDVARARALFVVDAAREQPSLAQTPSLWPSGLREVGGAP